MSAPAPSGCATSGPSPTRLSEGLRSSASGLVLGVAAVGTFLEPAIFDLAVPASALYALWVLTRRVKLPLRLPRSAACPDVQQPDARQPQAQAGERDARSSAGASTGHELWVTAEDARQHIAIPGTTGAGKTTAILSLLVNALAQGSGFVLVDGKADRDLFGKVLALGPPLRSRRRRAGAELHGRLRPQGQPHLQRRSPSAMPTRSASCWRASSASRQQNDPNGVFRERAVALIGTIAPVLVWLRDHKGVPLNIEVIRFSIELRWIWKLAMEKIVLLRDPDTGNVTRARCQRRDPRGHHLAAARPISASCPAMIRRCRSTSRRATSPRSSTASRSSTSPRPSPSSPSRSATSSGSTVGDIDMRDVVLNRRILVVNLPALENSDATLAALGKLVVASLRGMMAQLLGASLEGDYTEADKPGMGPSPFPVVLDELAYYATSGLDRMLAMGRGLNICFMLGFQEVSGIWARLGEKTASLLGNANLTIAMRQQDCRPHPRMDREDRRPDLHHAGDRLSGCRTTAPTARRVMPRSGRSRASTGTT